MSDFDLELAVDKVKYLLKQTTVVVSGAAPVVVRSNNELLSSNQKCTGFLYSVDSKAGDVSLQTFCRGSYALHYFINCIFLQERNVSYF